MTGLGAPTDGQYLSEVHWVQTVAPFPDMNVPLPQGAQLVPAIAVWKVPALQLVHTVAPMPAMYVPMEQLPQMERSSAPMAVENVPIGHKVGAEPPPKQYPPAVQLVHTERPVVPAKVQPGQGVGVEAFTRQ